MKPSEIIARNRTAGSRHVARYWQLKRAWQGKNGDNLTVGAVLRELSTMQSEINPQRYRRFYKALSDLIECIILHNRSGRSRRKKRGANNKPVQMKRCNNGK